MSLNLLKLIGLGSKGGDNGPCHVEFASQTYLLYDSEKFVNVTWILNRSFSPSSELSGAPFGMDFWARNDLVKSSISFLCFSFTSARQL